MVQVKYIRSRLMHEEMPKIFVDTITNAQGQLMYTCTCTELAIYVCVCGGFIDLYVSTNNLLKTNLIFFYHNLMLLFRSGAH